MRKYLLFVFVALVLQACGSTSPKTATAAPIPATDTVLTATIEPIIHKIIPQEGSVSRSNAHDQDESASFANKNVTAGDDFRKNQFERPFTTNEMTYLPDLDIVDFGITSDDQFFYIKIVLAGVDLTSQSVTGTYGVEIDRNSDGRAEIMLVARPPYSGEFSTDNMLVLVDKDGDIGGAQASKPDEAFSGNGYDGVIFDLSQNIHPNDPDLAWVRVIEGEKPAIEIAYRKWIFKGGNESFMWNVWTSGVNNLTPASFNLHDSISEALAGSPNQSNANYPIKDLAQFDNTCRVPLGFTATGNEPLGCAVKAADQNDGGESIPFCDQFTAVCERIPAIPSQPICFKAGDPACN